MHAKPLVAKPVVVIGLIGTQLDSGTNLARWDRWRPTVSLAHHEDLEVHRYELLRQAQFEAIGDVVADDLRALAPGATVNQHIVEFSDAWDFEAVFETLANWADGYDFDPEREDYLVHITTGTHVAQICWFLLTEARFVPGRLVQTAPPRRNHDAGAWRIIDLQLQRYDRIARRFADRQAEAIDFLKQGIGTRNERFNAIMAEIEHVAIASRAPILLTGPTGAGKTRLARRVFDLKRRRGQVEGRFVELNCATLRGDAAMSALFGHRRGAFTGAVEAREGLLREANGGLLFLDEIGELGLDEQAMLLRALEEKRFLPVGADREVESDFQLIGGTNRDLWDEVAKGTFREDLLARINLWTWRLPGLRERIEDLEPNLDFELLDFARREGRRVTFNQEARAAFLHEAQAPGAAWRGNFRDLNAAVVRMSTLAPGGRIDEATVADEMVRLQRGWGTVGVDDPSGLRALLGDEAFEQLDRFDRVQLQDVVEVCREARSLSAAGRALFSESRKLKTSNNDADRLRKYLARFGLTWQQVNPE